MLSNNIKNKIMKESIIGQTYNYLTIIKKDFKMKPIPIPSQNIILVQCAILKAIYKQTSN